MINHKVEVQQEMLTSGSNILLGTPVVSFAEKMDITGEDAQGPRNTSPMNK
jgi:hypothetical protein